MQTQSSLNDVISLDTLRFDLEIVSVSTLDVDKIDHAQSKSHRIVRFLMLAIHADDADQVIAKRDVVLLRESNVTSRVNLTKHVDERVEQFRKTTLMIFENERVMIVSNDDVFTTIDDEQILDLIVVHFQDRAMNVMTSFVRAIQLSKHLNDCKRRNDLEIMKHDIRFFDITLFVHEN